LIVALGHDIVAVGDAISPRHHTDWSGMTPTRPLALVRPRSTQQVCALMRLCTRHRVPAVPQGGLSGMAGDAIPQVDSVALSLDRMHAIDPIDTAAATVTVQAGATLQSVQEAAAAQGLQFGVDLGARGSCQIGGNLSTNAGGNGVLQFGMMREQTLGLEVVLADGTLLPMLRPMQKNNTGYDLKQFFIGAEGTLGIITRAVLRLHPAPRARATVLVALEDFDASLVLLGRLKARFTGAVAAFELMWRDFVAASLKWQSLREPFEAAHPFVALVELTGNDEVALREAVEDELGAAMAQGLAADVAIAQSQAQAQARAFWKIRETTAELPANMHPPLNFDVSLPMAEIGRVAALCRTALDVRWPGQHSLFFGHVGDSNLHISTDMATIDGSE